ncbi:T9SS type A sorting domain-containing protein [Aequorivita todarodis]|uniref:T9SS type A sorting domain-containing protein n=1 Tax=Aequorivita todarodis TaxID=2036821 RepID=UPI002350B322|nr:T9SS type A sorting domain-containing protein [Aequorivita todarodis]MDC8002223.1 T9SS type A sorting domain-containing protein [Aequorivita todarodis]
MKTITFVSIVLFCTISFSQIRINEVDSDQTGTDVTEFVEILSDSPNFSLEGYLVVFYNGTDDESYKTVDLTGYVTDSEGFFIIGSSATPGVDIAIGTSNTIQNGPDAIAIYQDSASNFPNGTPVTNVNLIDAIVYGTNDDDDPELLAGLGQTVQYDEDLNGNKDTESIQNDGAGSFCVDVPTLRATNACFLSIDGSKTNVFNIYPNPATKGYVDITSKVNGAKTITIFDILGKQVLKTTFYGDRLDISTLNSGVYILKIEQGKSSATKKLVVK